MRVLIIGFHSIWELPFHCKEAMASLGVKVRLFYTNKKSSFLGAFSKKLFPRTETTTHPTDPPNSWFHHGLLKLCSTFRPDLVFVIKGDDLPPETLQALKQLGRCTLANWVTDDPFVFPELVQGLPLYDLVFTFDLSYREPLERAGAKRVVLLPFACNPNLHRSVLLTPWEKRRYGSDVCFVGSVHQSRIPLFKSMMAFDFVIWEDPVHQFSESKELWERYRGKVSQKTMARIYNASKITLNPHHPHAITGTNMRTFEAAACGIFQLTGQKQFLEETFEMGKELVCYQDDQEVKAMVRYYLSNEMKRREIARRAQKKVHATHTYHHRMRQVLQEAEKHSALCQSRSAL